MEKSSSSLNQEPLIISVSPNPQFDSTNEDRPSNGIRSYYPKIDYLSKDQFREDVDYLQSKGFDKKMITKVYILLKPKTKEQAEHMMTPVKGIYPHEFYPSKRSSSNKCIICGAEEESHKKKKEKQSIVGNMLRERFGLNEESKNSNADVTLEDKENENDKKICMICDCELTDKEYSQNKLKCNHLCCNECWFRFLSGQINEAKVSNIKCFDYKCETELTETFITQKIIRDISLFQKYKAFKLKAEIMKSPNKKFCPYPGCGSFIERSPEEGKYVQCENGHKSCYVCLKKWHGKSQCEEELEKDFQIWKVGKVIKRCPQCHFYTEKNK